MLTTENKLSLPLEFKVDPVKLKRIKRRMRLFTIFVGGGMAIFLAVTGFHLLFMHINILRTMKQYGYPIGVFDLLGFLYPLIPLAVLIWLFSSNRKNLKRMDLQHVILGEAQLERVTSYSTETILFDDIKDL